MKDSSHDIIAGLKIEIDLLRSDLASIKKASIQAEAEAKHHRHSLELVNQASLKMAQSFDRLMDRTRRGITQRLRIYGVEESVIGEIEKLFPLRLVFPKHINAQSSEPPSSESA